MPYWLLKSVLFIHVLSSIVGFGAVALNSFYAAQARKRPGPGGIAILEANGAASRVGENLILVVLVSGLVLVAFSKSGITWGRTWVWLSIVLFAVASALSYGIVQPAARRMVALLKAPGEPGLAEQSAMASAGHQLRLYGPILNILGLMILLLMVFRPTL
jgi:hypothetical protein